MGTTTDSQSGRRLLVAAVAALAAVTGVSFGRVFQDTHPGLRLAVAGVLAVAIGALLERRHLALTMAASTAGLIVSLGILVFPGTTWNGVPTADTLQAIAGALARAGHRAAREVAPAAPLPSLMTAALIAVWSAGAASHALAVRARATALPLLPGAALLGFVGVVTQEPPRPGYVVAFLAASFALLFAEALLRTGVWSDGGGRRALVATRWARTLGVSAIVLALAVPGVLPGYRSDALLQLGDRQQAVSVSPIVDIRPSLLRNPPGELFRVRAPRPAYWRMAVLDRFDGNVWSSSGLASIEGPILSGVQVVAGARPSGAFLEQRFTMARLSTTWLPAAAHPLRVEIDGELGARHDADTGVLTLDSPTDEGVEYSVTSSTPTPTAAELDRIDPSEHFPGLRALPPGLPPRIREIATEVTAGAETPFRKAFAIQEHLRTFRYDEHAPAGHGSHAILDFLEETRQGYCEQFAGTMAVMVRALGLPARVAIGFLPGTRDTTGAYRVHTDDVHAWPEVFFEAHGWLAFEPTPTRANPTARYLVDVPSRPDLDADLASGRPASDDRFRDRLEREAFTRPRQLDAPNGAAAAAAKPRSSPWRSAMLVVAVLAVLTAVLLAAAKALRRRRAIRARGDARRRVVAAYRWMASGAADLGMGRRRGETLWEYRARLAGDRAVPAEALDRLTGVTGRALFSTRPIVAEEADEAVASARAVLAALRSRAGVTRIALGAIRLPSD